MSEVNFVSNYGNFDYEMSVKLTDESLSPAAKSFIKEGLANIAYRVCGSAVDKALGVLPESKGGTGRRGIEYSQGSARIIETTVWDKLATLGLKDVGFKIIGEHEYGEAGSAMLRATTLVDTLLDGGKEEQLRATLAMFGATDKDDRAGLIRIAHKAGLGIQPPKAPKAKSTAKAAETGEAPEVEVEETVE